MKPIEEYDLFKKAHGLNVRLIDKRKGVQAEERFLVSEALKYGTGVNIALIEGAYTGKGEFRPSLDRAFARAAGAKYFIGLLKETGLFEEEEGCALEDEAVGICKMISGLRNKIDKDVQDKE